MSTILVIPDLHNRVETAEKILKAHEQNVDYAVLLGDYFDDFFDTVGDAAGTAAWLKESLQNPKRIHLIGNHDINYREPFSPVQKCAGFTEAKKKRINIILTPKDWARLQWFHYEPVGNWLFSHAGAQLDILPEYDQATSPLDILKFAIKNAEKCLKSKTSHPILKAGFCRGGNQSTGGIIWLDWGEFIPPKTTAGFSQVVGHSPRAEPQVCYREQGIIIRIAAAALTTRIPFPPSPTTLMAYNLDTHARHYAIITEDKLTVHPTM